METAAKQRSRLKSGELMNRRDGDIMISKYDGRFFITNSYGLGLAERYSLFFQASNLEIQEGSYKFNPLQKLTGEPLNLDLLIKPYDGKKIVEFDKVHSFKRVIEVNDQDCYSVTIDGTPVCFKRHIWHAYFDDFAVQELMVESELKVIQVYGNDHLFLGAIMPYRVTFS